LIKRSKTINSEGCRLGKKARWHQNGEASPGFLLKGSLPDCSL
jgi:hypothetical protein